MPEYTEAEIEELKRNAKKEFLDGLIKASGTDSEASMLAMIKLAKEKNPLELEKKLSATESELAKTRVSKEVLSASHKHGFKDTSYAEYLFNDAYGKASDEDKKKLNADSFIEKLKADENYKHHFFGRKQPANSGGSGAPDPRDGDQTKPKSVMDMKPEEVERHINDLGYSPRI